MVISLRTSGGSTPSTEPLWHTEKENGLKQTRNASSSRYCQADELFSIHKKKLTSLTEFCEMFSRYKHLKVLPG